MKKAPAKILSLKREYIMWSLTFLAFILATLYLFFTALNVAETVKKDKLLSALEESKRERQSAEAAYIRKLSAFNEDLLDENGLVKAKNISFVKASEDRLVRADFLRR